MVYLSVPKYLPPSLSEGITTIYGILEPDSPSSSEVFLNGIIANEKVRNSEYIYRYDVCLFLLFNGTFNNNSAISWRFYW